MKTLIINADDFGLTHSVNDAIIDTFQCGCVTSTTLMVNASATMDAVEKAMLHPKLGVGLHFNITLGRPVSDAGKVASLVDRSGHFYSRNTLARRLLMRQVSKLEIELELRAQYELMKSYNLHPTHIDSHQHIHAFGKCFDAVASLCKLEDIPMRMPWILNIQSVHATAPRRIKQWVLSRMLSRNCQLWQGKVHWNSGLGSVFDLGTMEKPLDITHYRALLESASEGTFELMVHPARDANKLQGLTRIGDVSEMEWRFLMSGDLPPLISELGFTLGSYASL